MKAPDLVSGRGDHAEQTIGDLEVRIKLPLVSSKEGEQAEGKVANESLKAQIKDRLSRQIHATEEAVWRTTLYEAKSKCKNEASVF